MKDSKPKMAIANGNGTYRIPLNRFELRIEGNPPCLFGSIADAIGRMETIGTIEELEEMKREICG